MVPLTGAQSAPKASGSPGLRDCVQSCFSHYVSNQSACYDVNCTSILGITLGCNDAALNLCLSHAEEVWEACIGSCNGSTTVGS
ncbi:MAG TPA: hypothetical protein VKE69_06250 [Planctomycetota bacterium]|nr:hypothetical protein [Planctomycetota bacterium]